jgi:hypothetical protein
LLACEEASVFQTGGGPGSDEPSSCAEVTAVSDEVASALSLDRDFYAQHCSALGIDVLGADGVSAAAMLESGRILEGLLDELPDVRDAMHDRYFRVVVVASSTGQELRDVPELHGLRKVENAAAGLGPDPDFPAATIRDSVIVCRPRGQDALATPPGDTLVHEIGHGILDMGLAHTDESFRDALEDAYDDARDDGRWTIALPAAVEALFGKQPTENYLMRNPAEYFATGVSAWHGFKPIPLAYGLTDDDPPRLRLEVSYGRDALAFNDPGLARLLAEVFGEDPALKPSCEGWAPSFDAR